MEPRVGPPLAGEFHPRWRAARRIYASLQVSLQGIAHRDLVPEQTRSSQSPPDRYKARRGVGQLLKEFKRLLSALRADPVALEDGAEFKLSIRIVRRFFRRFGFCVFGSEYTKYSRPIITSGILGSQ